MGSICLICILLLPSVSINPILYLQGKLKPASELLWMKETQNLTLRLFDAIGVHQTSKDIRENLEYSEEERRTDKTELRKEYSMPEILNQDIFETCQVQLLELLCK